MKVTMEAIARVAGVSKATVSRVLNGVDEGVSMETRQRVQRIADELHYSFKRDEKKITCNHNLLSLILPDITNPFFADIAKAVDMEAKKCGYSTIISNTDFSEENEIAEIQKLVRKRVDGIILVPSGIQFRSEHQMPRKYGIPMVLLDRKLEGNSDYLGIYSNNEYAAVVSCNRLIQSGSREIVFISGPLNTSTSIERFEGYKAVLAQNGIPFHEEMCKNGNYTVESGYRAVMDLERSGIKYTAILSANDLMAIGALNAIRELGYQIPEDIQIIGFDNIEFSQYCDPPLSTMQQPTFEMGTKVVNLLRKLILGELPEQPDRLIPRIVMRKTTK